MPVTTFRGETRIRHKGKEISLRPPLDPANNYPTQKESGGKKFVKKRTTDRDKTG